MILIEAKEARHAPEKFFSGIVLGSGGRNKDGTDSYPGRAVLFDSKRTDRPV